MSTSDNTPIPEGYKRCKKCGSPRLKYQSCAECTRRYKHEYYLSHKERHKELMQRWNEDHREYRLAQMREYAVEHKEKFREYHRRYRIDHPEVSREKGRAAYHAHIERRREYDKRRGPNRLRHEDPQARKVRAIRRKARKLSLPDHMKKSDWIRCLAYWHDRCAICGRPRGLWHTLAADHWIPLSNPQCPGTVPGNILPLCHGQDGCNNRKHNNAPIEWLYSRYSKRKADKILKAIETYFQWVKDQTHG